MTDTVTLTITPDLRRFRAATARAEGKHDLADVVTQQPGRQIVRDGLGDVLHWLKECACHDDGTDERCAYVVQREREVIEGLAAAMDLAVEHVREMVRRITAAAITTATQDDYTLAPPPHRAGRDAQRSPYGPATGRRW